MKKLFIIVLVLFAKNTFAQKDTVGVNTPYKNQLIVYERVFNAPGKSRSDLFGNAQLWFFNHYRSTNGIQINDADAGRIVGNGIETINFKAILGIDVVYDAKLSIQIDCKDGKYRCRIFNIVLDSQTQGKDKVITRAEELMKALLGQANISQLNKNESKRALQSLNTMVNDTMQSLNSIMTDSDNF